MVIGSTADIIRDMEHSHLWPKSLEASVTTTFVSIDPHSSRFRKLSSKNKKKYFDYPYAEPSGLTFLGESEGDKTLFMVSDEGRIGRSENEGESWAFHDFVEESRDIESVFTIPGDEKHIYLGFEGFEDDRNTACIYSYNVQENASDGPFWKLNTEKGKNLYGAEAMTFVPSGNPPFSEKGKSKGNLDGICLVTSQDQKGEIYQYRLPEKTSASNLTPLAVIGANAEGGKLPIFEVLHISDLCWDDKNKALWVLYDIDKRKSSCVIQVLFTDSEGAIASHSLAYDIHVGAEGIAIDGDDIYIGIDMSGKQALNTGECIESYVKGKKEKCRMCLNYVLKYEGLAAFMLAHAE